jgi:hypothetical protein
MLHVLSPSLTIALSLASYDAVDTEVYSGLILHIHWTTVLVIKGLIRSGFVLKALKVNNGLILRVS